MNIQVRHDSRTSVERLDSSETCLDRERNAGNGDVAGVGCCDDCSILACQLVPSSNRLPSLRTARASVQIERNVRRVGDSVKEVLVCAVVERLEGLVLERENESSLGNRRNGAAQYIEARTQNQQT